MGDDWTMVVCIGLWSSFYESLSLLPYVDTSPYCPEEKKMTPREMWERMMDAKSWSYKDMLAGKNPVYLQAYATLLKDVHILEERLPPRIRRKPKRSLRRRSKRASRSHKTSLPQFPGKMMEVWKIVPAGTRVRVVMASRFGDVGITQYLDSNRGYEARIPVVDEEEPWLGDISNLFTGFPDSRECPSGE